MKTKKKNIKKTAKKQAPVKDQIPEQNISGPIKINRDSLILSMRRLNTNADFSLLRSLWLGIRADILENGKKKPSEAAWSRLDGFDMAILEIGKWSVLDLREEKNRQADALAETY